MACRVLRGRIRMRKFSHFLTDQNVEKHFFFFFLPIQYSSYLFVIETIHPYYGFLVAQLVKKPPAMWKTWLGKEAMGDSLVAQMVKNPPAIQETQAQSLDQEDPLEKGMATHSSILAWRIPWTEEPGRI